MANFNVSKPVVVFVLVWVFIMMAVFFSINKKWNDSLAASFSSSSQTEFIKAGEYTVFLQGETENEVDSVIDSLSDKLNILSRANGNLDIPLNLNKISSVSHSMKDAYCKSIGTIEVVGEGDYSLYIPARTEGVKVLLVDTSFMTFLYWMIAPMIPLVISGVGFAFWVLNKLKVINFLMKHFGIDPFKLWK